MSLVGSGTAAVPVWWTRARTDEVVARLGGDADIEAVLAEAMDDDVTVVLPAPAGWVRPDGTPCPAPAPPPTQVVSALHREGALVALVVHRRLSRREERLFAALHDALALAAVDARLALDLEQAARTARRSRAEAAAAGDDARRRIERDLHDGAQQRLVATALAVQLLRMDVDDDALDRALGAVGTDVQAALADLRRLARGLYPAILSEQGLFAALVTLAEESVVPVRVLRCPQGRLPVDVEAAAYFAVVAVSTGATGPVDVCALVEGPVLRVRLDGVSLDPDQVLVVQDRVVAAGGRLHVTASPPVVVLELPAGTV